METVGLCEAKTHWSELVARAHGLSAYDSLYFELALRRRAALATYDAGMIAAAPRAGVRLFPDPKGPPA